MKQWLPLLVCLLLGGCQGGGEAKKSPVAEKPETNLLANYQPSKISSAIAIKYRDVEVRVGDKAPQAYERLLGGRTGGFTSELLPQGLKAPYAAQIWQGADDAFGLVSYEGLVVLAMVQETRTNQEHANNVRVAHQELMGNEQPQIVAGEKVTYYFWSKSVGQEGENERQRLMIMIFQNRDSIFLTVAAGDERVMDVLGMSPDQARQDQTAADGILRTLEAGENAAKK